MFNIPSDDEKVNTISKKVTKILDSQIENDKEALTALKELSTYFPDNSIQARRNLRSTIEKRSLGINEGFLHEFRKIKENLDLIYEDVFEMNKAVQNMSSQLLATKAETHKLIEQTSKLQTESTKLSIQETIAKQFINTFQLSPSELASMKDSNITNDFFFALERVQTIHGNCRILMQSGHQNLALEIMDQMSLYQETALEKLYRWAQSYCKNIESPGTSQLLTRALSKLQDRPVLFKYVVSEYCAHRRSVLVRIFLDALTKGGPGGTPKPIEMSAHDPQRYISDMLAYLHQSIPGENENLVSFLKGCDKTDITEEIQEALANISEGVITPLRIRIEHIIALDIPLKTLYSITNLLCFYRETFSQEIGEGGLVRGLKDLEESSSQTLLTKLTNVVRKEVVERVAVSPSDLSPSAGVESLLNLLKDLLSVAPVSESQHNFLNKMVSCVLDPLLQAVNISASRLATTDMAVYLLNCLHLIISTVSLYEFLDDRIERLQAQCDAQIDTLTSEQASFFVANLNLGPIYTILQDHSKGGQSLSQIPGMQPTSLHNFITKFENFISMPELLLLPQVTCLLSSTHRMNVQKRSIQVIVAIYTQLYSAVNEPSNGYPDTMNLKPPKDISEVLLGTKPN